MKHRFGDLNSMMIREALDKDFDAIWPIFHEVVLAGDTYPYPEETSKAEGKILWIDIPRKTFIAKSQGEILGTYYIKNNQTGPGSHVCNCGYMVATSARRNGIGEAMCLHSQKTAIKLGYKAMQFNFVSSSNIIAIALWQKMGFETIGSLPKAFNHPTKGYIDALVMYKWLES